MVRKGHDRIRRAEPGARGLLVPGFVAVALLALLPGCGMSIHDAAGGGYLEKVQSKLEANPGAVNAPDPLGKTPLFFAITYGKEDMVEYLIERGADVNAHDKTGLTPLHVPPIMSRPACADLLVKAGAEIDAVDEFGDTPLHSGAIHGMTGMIGFLVRRGADIHAKNNKGLTPIDLARKYGQERAVEKLRSLLDSPVCVP